MKGEIFQGKVALVTGAASGIGRASATAFAKRGAKVIVCDIDAENGQQAVQAIEQAGGKALFIKADVTKAAEVETLISKTVQTLGRLDYAHNNAGILEASPFTDTTEEQWDRVMSINLKGIWLCMKYELLHMTKHGGGVIVNTSSIAGLIAVPGSFLYTVSKWGVRGLTKSSATEFAKAGIRVNAVCPAAIKGTGMYKRQLAKDPDFSAKMTSDTPMGRDGTPEEVAEAVVWLCSDSASFVTGACVPIDGARSAV